MTSSQLASTGTYCEARSALSSPFLLLTVVAPAGALVAMVAATILVPYSYSGVPATLIGVAVMVGWALAYRSWPTGIRIDVSAITIGAVTVKEQDLKWLDPTAYHQAHGVYSCRWQGVDNARVVTDKAELRAIAKSREYYTFTNRWAARPAMTRCKIGVLTAPFMRAALLVDVHPSAVTATPVRPVKAYSISRGDFPRLIRPELSLTWVVPTRHPQALEQALRYIRQHQDRLPDWPSV